jgi:NAD(P)-dependent dehydrogenase (short-subunit alcohol dehydrogenase family)/acyl dehydratase/acyl carrier protein
MKFEDFQVGDYASFRHTFTSEDFDLFSRFSGDRNRLHHDADYARTCGYPLAVVPLHMVLAPLSRIAGMIFPGPQSLYVGHSAEALHPVYYGDPLTYSARILSCHEAGRILVLRVIALRDVEVVLAGRMTVQVRPGEWIPEASQPTARPASPRAALITGASGEIGSALALRLARDNWNLFLHYHKNDERVRLLQRACVAAGARVDVRAGALDQPGVARDLGVWAAQDEALAAVLHVASPGVHGGRDPLMAVNVQATVELADAVLPRLLARQDGTLLFMSSSAVEYQPRGWEDYVAAKVAGTNYVTALNRSYAAYGVRGRSVLPGYVQTAFSRTLVPPGAPTLIPEEVADYVISEVLGTAGDQDAFVLEPSFRRSGHFGFHEPGPPVAASYVAEPGNPPARADRRGLGGDHSDLYHRLQQVLRDTLHVSADLDLTQARLGKTPGWDSLRQLELVVAIEREFNVQFASHEIMVAHSFQGLLDLLQGRNARVPNEQQHP